MILLKILVTLFFKVSKSFLDLISFDELNTLTSDLSTVEFVFPELVKFVAYFLDSRFFTILMPIEICWISIKIIFAILMRIKSFIPTISST